MKKFILLILSMLMMLLPLSACTKDIEGTIKVNEVTHSIFYAPMYLAINNGYFAEEGLTIDLTNGGGADKSMAAVLSNDADIGLMGPEAAIYVQLEGKSDYAQVFGQLTKRDGAFLVSRTPEPNFDYTELEGKEILMGRRGGVPAMTLQYILNQHGYINGKNITMNYDVQFNVLAATFTSGVGDYVPLFEPTASELVSNGKGHIVSSIGAKSGEVPYTAFMAKKSYIKKNSAQLEKFLKCIHKATQFILSNDNDTVAKLLAPSFLGTNEKTIAASLANYRANDAWMVQPSMKEASFNRLQDIMQNAGELPTRTTFDKIVDNSIADKVGK